MRYFKTGWQRGIALLMAMLVMSLATMLAVSLSTNQQLFFRRTENLLYHEQAYQNLLAAEDFGKWLLAQDAKDNKTDTMKENWAKKDGMQGTIDGFPIGGSIEDLQGRFNINDLADPKDKAAVEAFKRLLSMNKIPQDLVNAVQDWIDTDSQVRFPAGAENADYMQGERAYGAANRMMSSVSELLFVKGFTYPMYEAIAPALIALPTAGIPVNVNTAKPEVLRMIVNGLSQEDAQSLSDDLAKHPVADIKDFLSNPLVKGKAVPTTQIDVRSAYFMIHAYSNIGRARATLDSIVERVGGNKVETLQRSQGGI